MKMEAKSSIKEWNHILVDTSFIIDYLSDPSLFDGNPVKKENIIISNDIMNALSTLPEGKRPQFYVTSVTVSELQKFETARVIKEIIATFSSGDVTFLNFGKNEALVLHEYASLLKRNKECRKKEKEIQNELKNSGVSNYRQYITNDLTILSCVKRLFEKNQLDVILTSDGKTFKPLADFMGLPCNVTTSKYFPENLFGEHF